MGGYPCRCLGPSSIGDVGLDAALLEERSDKLGDSKTTMEALNSWLPGPAGRQKKSTVWILHSI